MSVQSVANTPSQASVQASITSAVSQGMVSPEAAEAMSEQLDQIAIAGAQGVGVDDIDSEDATLVTVILDASWSMLEHRQAVIDAYNKHFLTPLRKSKNADSILVTCWIFSSHGGEFCRLVHGFKPIPECDDLTMKVYNPDGGTPLYEALSRGLTGLVSYGQTLRDAGTTTKCIAVVLSDGEENDSHRQFTAMSIRTMSESLLNQEIYILSYCFFGHDSEAAKYAKAIGFPDRHRLTVGLNDSDIRRLFGQVSASVISASQTKVSAAGLSQNAFFAGAAQPRGSVLDDD